MGVVQHHGQEHRLWNHPDCLGSHLSLTTYQLLLEANLLTALSLLFLICKLGVTFSSWSTCERGNLFAMGLLGCVLVPCTQGH